MNTDLEQYCDKGLALAPHLLTLSTAVNDPPNSVMYYAKLPTDAVDEFNLVKSIYNFEWINNEYLLSARSLHHLVTHSSHLQPFDWKLFWNIWTRFD